MTRRAGSRFVMTYGEYAIEACADGYLPQYDEWRRRASLVDESPVEADHDVCTIGVRGAANDLVSLLIAHGYRRAGGFAPGLMLVPETRRLFVGIGEHIAIYGLDPPARCWDDWTEFGFLGWARYGDVILMAAELELAAWDLIGSKLWATPVEPPWTYSVAGELVRLDIAGKVTAFGLQYGPDPDTPTAERRRPPPRP